MREAACITIAVSPRAVSGSREPKQASRLRGTVPRPHLSTTVTEKSQE